MLFDLCHWRTDKPCHLCYSIVLQEKGEWQMMCVKNFRLKRFSYGRMCHLITHSGDLVTSLKILLSVLLITPPQALLLRHLLLMMPLLVRALFHRPKASLLDV